MRFTYLLVLVVVFFSSVASAGLVVGPSNYNLNLTAGDTASYSFTITWDGPEIVMGFIDTNVTPDMEGIYVYYSKNPVILHTGTTKINVTVYTALNLAPKTYTISSEVSALVDDYYKNLNFNTSNRLNETSKKLNESLFRIENLSKELKVVLENLSTLSESDEKLEQIIGNLTDEIEELRQSLEDLEPAEEDRQPTMEGLLIFFIFALIIITGGAITLLYIERKKKSSGGQNDDEEKGLMDH